LEKVGQSLSGSLQGDRGHLVVTWVKPGEEIRFAWEPEQGHYACRITVKLASKGKGTRIEIIDSYSDEKPDHIASNAKAAKAHLSQSLEQIKEMLGQ
jgi:hypothetical protein